jgi:hypothetical protein
MMKYGLPIFLSIALLGYWVPQDKSSQQTSGKNSFIKVEFDPSKKETSVSIDPFLAINIGYNADIGMMAISGRFTYSGQTKVSIPQQAEMRFISISRIGWQFANEKDLNLTAIVDGENLSLGRAARVSAKKQLEDSRIYDKRDPNYRESYKYIEAASAFVSYENFAKIANGRRLEIRLGTKNLKIEKKHMEAYQALYRAMSQ